MCDKKSIMATCYKNSSAQTMTYFNVKHVSTSVTETTIKNELLICDWDEDPTMRSGNLGRVIYPSTSKFIQPQPMDFADPGYYYHTINDKINKTTNTPHEKNWEKKMKKETRKRKIKNKKEEEERYIKDITTKIGQKIKIYYAGWKLIEHKRLEKGISTRRDDLEKEEEEINVWLEEKERNNKKQKKV